MKITRYIRFQNDLKPATLKEAQFLTFQRTMFQVCGLRRSPWALRVENRVCPALFRTGGLTSIHRSPTLWQRAYINTVRIVGVSSVITWHCKCYSLSLSLNPQPCPQVKTLSASREFDTLYHELIACVRKHFRYNHVWSDNYLCSTIYLCMKLF